MILESFVFYYSRQFYNIKNIVNDFSICIIYLILYSKPFIIYI